MVFKDAKRCKARCKSTGKQCKNPAVKGFDVCRMHGAHTNGSKRPGRKPGSKKPPGSGRGAARGNTRAMTYGASTTKLPAHLVEAREEILAGYLQDMENPTYADRKAVGRVATLEAKFDNAIADPDCPARTLEVIHRALHVELKALKATRASREQTSTGTSPAEVIANILAKVSERRRQLQEGRQILAPRVVQHVPAPAQQTADDQDEWPGDDDRECVDAEPWDGDQAEAEAGDDCDDEPDAREPTADESDDQDDSDWWPD